MKHEALDTVAAMVLPTVMRDEGFRAAPYLDGNAKWTIGFGTRINVIDHDEAMFLLEHRLHKAALACRQRFPWFAALDGLRQGVIAQMAYQMGVDGIAGFREMGRAIAAAVTAPTAELRATFFAAAAAEMLDSKWARHDSPARAQRRATEMRTGKLARG